MTSCRPLPLCAILNLAAVACVPVGESKQVSPLPGEWVPGAGDTYVKNPDVTLKREYWLVARASTGAHYLIPRADGASAIVAECRNDGPQAPLFRAALLCESASSATQVNRVNSLSRDEALQTSSFLHARLRFAANAATGSAIEPFPHIRDILDLCRAHPEIRSGVIKERCDRELEFAKGGARPDIAHPFTATEAAALIPLLNTLYGIP